MIQEKRRDLSLLTLILALVNHNGNEFETTCPTPDMLEHGAWGRMHTEHTGGRCLDIHPSILEIYQISL